MTIKFSSKSALEKIIEYINFESANKYALIFNSRPGTRGNLSVASKPASPTARKMSGTKATNRVLSNRQKSSNLVNKNGGETVQVERKSARFSTKTNYFAGDDAEHQNEYNDEDFVYEDDRFMASFKSDHLSTDQALENALNKVF